MRAFSSGASIHIRYPVFSLSSQGTATTLNEDDVWEVSPHHRAGPLLSRYMSVKGKTLLRKLWIVNSLDLMYVIRGLALWLALCPWL